MYSWFPNDDPKTDWPSGEPLGPSIRNVAIPASSLQYTKLEGSPDPELDGHKVYSTGSRDHGVSFSQNALYYDQ